MEYLTSYSNFLKKHLKVSRSLKVVCDSSNGTTGFVLKKVFEKNPNIKLILINDKPDGNFPAHGPNPLSPGALDQTVEKVLKEKADFGAIFDADGDRVFFIDDKGQLLSSFISAIFLFKNSKPPFVADETSYQALKIIRAFSKKNLRPSKVGYPFIRSKMKESKASAAVEYSGHFYFKEFFGADSGIFAFIKMLNFISKSRTCLSQFVRKQPNLFVELEQIEIESELNYWENRVKDYFLKHNFKIENRDGITAVSLWQFINIRASNTEPLLRLTCGSKLKTDCKKAVADLKKILKLKNIRTVA